MKGRGPIVAGVVSAAVALLLIVFLVLPKMSQVGKAEDELSAAKDQEVSLQVQLRALQDAQAAAPETQAQIEALDVQVPPTADLPDLFRLLQSTADRSAVDFFQFAPGNPTPDASGKFSIIPSGVTVTGSYFSLEEFLYGLETLPRAAKVTSITVSPQGESTEAETGTTTTTVTSPGGLSMQLTVEFYTTDITAGPGATVEPTASPTEAPPAEGATGATGPSQTGA